MEHRHSLNGKSSSIAHCLHDDEKNILTIKFTSGHTYYYSDCPKFHFDGLRDSKSAGKYFHAHINGKYEHSR